MIIIINSIISIFVIYKINIAYLLIISGIITLQFFFNKIDLKFTLKKILHLLPIIITLIFLYSFFYNSGKIIKIINLITFYVDGFHHGIIISLRFFLSIIFIFSQNYITRKEYIIDSINKYFKKIIFLKRITNILFMTLYYIEIFFKKFSFQKKNKNKETFFKIIINTLIEIEKEVLKNKKLEKKNNKNYSGIIFEYFVFTILIFFIFIDY